MSVYMHLHIHSIRNLGFVNVPGKTVFFFFLIRYLLSDKIRSDNFDKVTERQSQLAMMQSLVPVISFHH